MLTETTHHPGFLLHALNSSLRCSYGISRPRRQSQRGLSPLFRGLVSEEPGPHSGLSLGTQLALDTRGGAFLPGWWSKGQSKGRHIFHSLVSYYSHIFPREREGMEIFILCMSLWLLAAPVLKYCVLRDFKSLASSRQKLA